MQAVISGDFATVSKQLTSKIWHAGKPELTQIARASTIELDAELHWASGALGPVVSLQGDAYCRSGALSDLFCVQDVQRTKS